MLIIKMKKIKIYFNEIKNFEAPKKEDLTREILNKFSLIEKKIKIISKKELFILNALILNKVNEIQIKRKERDYSNYLFFSYDKLKNKISKELKQRKRKKIPNLLKKEEILKKIIFDSSKNNHCNFPDTINEYLKLAGEEKIIMGAPKLFNEGRFPIIYYSNEKALKNIQKLKKTKIVSGHCLIGLDPNQNKLDQINAALSNGLPLHDLIIYDNLKKISKFLEKKIKIEGIIINLDTYYYKIKLLEILRDYPLESKNTNGIIEHLAEDHKKTIKKIFPKATLVKSDSKEDLKKLMEIVNGGLLDFIIKNIKEYMGHDLKKNKEMARALAVTSATYISPIIEDNLPILVIESALNTENPAKICQKYLKKIGKGDMLTFLSLFPLPDTKTSHGCMYYGNSNTSKIFLRNTKEEIKDKLENCNTDFKNPKNCFIINYHLSRGKQIPKECNNEFCKIHVLKLKEDIFNFLDKYK